jgi:hypothetical protein
MVFEINPHAITSGGALMSLGLDGKKRTQLSEAEIAHFLGAATALHRAC